MPSSRWFAVGSAAGCASCIARRAVLGEQGIQTEIDRLAARTAGAPVAGFFTYGEIARTRGVRGFHNETLVVLSIA
jgi:hypothetical protein